MDTRILIIIIVAVGLCLAWFAFKILTKVVKIVFIILIVAVLGFIVYHNFIQP